MPASDLRVASIAGLVLMFSACTSEPPPVDTTSKTPPVEPVVEAKPEVVAPPPVEAAAPKVCASELGDPIALFADRVLIRLPKGVELVEQTPFFARIAHLRTTSTCDAIVSYASVGFFQGEAGKSLVTLRDETIAAGRGLKDVTWSEETTKDRNYAGAYTAGKGPKGEPPLKGWFVLEERGGIAYWAMFETDPDAWNALKLSFQESGRKLLITKT